MDLGGSVCAVLNLITRHDCRTSPRLAYVCFYKIHGTTFIVHWMKKIAQVVVPNP